MADSVNEELYDRLVDNQAMSRLFENKVQTDVRRATRRHRDRLKQIVKVSPKSPEVRREINRYIKEVFNMTDGYLTEYGAEQFSFHTNSLHRAVGDIYKVQPPRRNPILADIVGNNVPNDASLDRQFARIGDNEFKRAQNIINRGLAKGLTTPEIANQVASTVKISENQATALVRTAITKVTNTAQLEVLNANAGIMKGYQFTAILDSRTSEICRYHDGRIYALDDTRNIPPLHWRCRSTIIPLAKSFNEILETQDPRIRKTVVKNISPQQRKKLDGRTIKKEGYGNWLRRQSYETKLRHLGGDENKVSLFDNGLVDIKEFFTSKGKQISIEALRRLDNFATTVFSQRRLIAGADDVPVKVAKPLDLMRDKTLTDDLRDFYITEASNQKTNLSLVDYKGTSLAGKRQSHRNASNVFDERTHFIDPVTGETKNSYLYDPDFQVFQERLDFLNASKILKQRQKDYITDFVNSLDEKMSVNQQTAVLENLRINFERFYDPQRPSYRQEWDNFEAIIRAEMKNSVVNVSRILDRRSRDRASQFRLWGPEGGEASIQIDGQWVTFSELADNLEANQKFVNNWRKSVGNPLARKAYYSGRSPLRFYFTDPIKNLTGLKKPSKALEEWIKKQPGGKRLWKTLEGRPQPTILEEAWANFLKPIKQPFKRILEQDLTLKGNLIKAREDFFAGKQNDKAIDAISEAFEMLATGTTTDYDTLAINMGKTLYQKYPLNLADKTPLLGAPNLQTYHYHGSRLLRMLEEKKMIRVTPRGVTRRAVTDIETGRPDGSWRDTVSREVLIRDKDLRELQIINRKLYVGKRVGIVNKRDELKIDIDTKKYKTRGGVDTGDSIVTRRANVYYDTIQIDKDIANEINWANSVEWKVDNEYSSFMLDLVRFRDPRGNVKKYDDLNGVRKIVMQREDMGLGMMQTVKWHRDRGDIFKIAHQIDSRGRIYARGYLTPTGGEFVRPFLNTAKSKPIGVDGWLAFQEQVGALVGPGTETLTNAGRFKVFREVSPQLLELGRAIQSTTQRDRRIRDVLEHPLLAQLDAEEHPKLLRLALEYTRIYDHVDGNLNDLAKIATYRSELPIEIDASASGAQVIALATKDRPLAFESNVVATPQKNRLYDIMAQDAMADPRFKALGRLPSDLTWEDLSKGAKYGNMVAFYGAGPATQAATFAGWFAKDLIKRDYVVVVRRRIAATPKEAFSQLELNKIIDNEIKDAKAIGAETLVQDLMVAKKELNDVIDKDAPIGSKLRSAARDIHPDVEDFVDKMSRTHAGLVGPNEFKEVSRIMSENLARRVPVTQTFITFWKDVARAYMTESKKTDIPWVTFDGKIMRQRYRPVLEEHINWIDPNTGRRVRNVYRGVAEDAKLKGKASIIDARTGLGVNGNHSNDAAIVRQFHLWGRRNNIPTATIHDAFFVNMADAGKAKTALRKIYADAVRSESVIETLKEMRKEGMSQKTYNELIRRAEREGIILPKEDRLTYEEVLRPLAEGEEWYGIGP